MRLLIICIISGFTQMCIAQKNAIYIEALGNGGFISMNYERQFFAEPKFSLRVGLGISFFEIDEKEPSSKADEDYGINIPNGNLSIPIALQYLFNIKHGNYLETGLGYTYQFGNDSHLGRYYDERVTHLFSGSLGFRRYFGQRKRWFWKINFTPIFVITDDATTVNGIAPWMGISVGKRF